MNATPATSVKAAVENPKPAPPKRAVKKPAASSVSAAKPVVAKTKTSTTQAIAVELPVENQIPPFTVKKKKSDKKKVIRDSFSFPEQDYHKISELKKICLSAGVHVKKGEILRAGLNLLTSLKLSELLKAVEKVERVRTGRPKSDKD
jgi:flagellar basal body-associated protein FliL